MSDNYVGVNRATWTKKNADHTDASAEQAWSSDITWGMWDAREDELHVLPDVDGKDAVELGCGTAYFSVYLARLGARVVGVDVTPAQCGAGEEMAVGGDLAGAQVSLKMQEAGA